MLGLSVEFTKADNASFGAVADSIRHGTFDISCVTFSLGVVKGVEGLPPVSAGHPVFIISKELERPVQQNLLLSTSDWRFWLLCLGIFGFVSLLKLILKQVRHIVKLDQLTLMMKVMLYFSLGIILSVYANFLTLALSIPVKEHLPFTTSNQLLSLLKSGYCKLVVISFGTESVGFLRDTFDVQSVDELIESGLLDFVSDTPSMLQKVTTPAKCFIGQGLKSYLFVNINLIEQNHGLDN